MEKVIGVQLKSGIKILEFRQEEDVDLGNLVLVETPYGEEMGRIVYKNKEVSDKSYDEIESVVKVLTQKDMERLALLKRENMDYMLIFKKKILEHGLNMKPVDYEFTLDSTKVTFYFTAESRVDFRELVRDFSKAIKKTVILKQMGQRDEARLLDGFGPCGRRVCCKTFLNKMENITMDLVREQYEGSRSASKVSGMCGRLMCCLAYESQNELKKGEKRVGTS